MSDINFRFSLTVRFSATAVSCVEIPTIGFILSLSFSTSKPYISAFPASAFVSAVSIFIVVVFPAPFTPRSDISSPLFTSRDKLSTAILFPYFFVKLFITIAFSFIAFLLFLFMSQEYNKPSAI